MPAMRPNIRSRGVATADAIVSGLAPGRFVNTVIVGYSTSGRRAMGRNRKATPPKRSKPMLRSDVATGRLINGAEMFIASFHSRDFRRAANQDSDPHRKPLKLV